MKRVFDYVSADAFLGKKNERPFAHNTRIERHEDGSIMAKYHGHIVADFYPDRSVYSSCGWKTSTTKERLNWFLPEPFSLYQSKSVWHLVKRDSNYNWRTNQSWVWADNVTIMNGQVFNAMDNAEVKRIEKLIVQIKKYVDGYIIAFLKGKVPEPSGGDCWACCMLEVNTHEEVMGTDHLLSHFKEKYYVPSLLMNSIRMFDVCQFTKGTIGSIWRGEDTREWEQNILAHDMKSSLTRYLKHRLGIAS